MKVIRNIPQIEMMCCVTVRIVLSGPSDRIRTCGILLPKQARYQLRYTRIQLLLYRKRKENATVIFGNLSGIAKEARGWYNGRKNRREDC